MKSTNPVNSGASSLRSTTQLGRFLSLRMKTPPFPSIRPLLRREDSPRRHSGAVFAPHHITNHCLGIVKALGISVIGGFRKRSHKSVENPTNPVFFDKSPMDADKSRVHARN